MTPPRPASDSNLRGPALVLWILVVWLALAAEPLAVAQDKPGKIPRPPETVQFKQTQLEPALIEASRFIRVVQARADFKVSGKGFTAAVLDTGLNAKHVDFKGRVVVQKNFTTDGGADDATDNDGHGTNVGGIIAADADHTGIAPGASLAPLKVLGPDGGSFDQINKALKWVLDNHKMHSITVVNMSLGDEGNYASADGFGADEVRKTIKALRDARVAVVVSAGNGYFTHQSKPGMSYPGIFPETVSVGAVYDANVGPFAYANGAKAKSTGPGRITPFSQRLHLDTSAVARTDIFAPGAPVTSSGKDGPNGESIQHGTSQAAPVTAGVILLMQEYYFRTTTELPTVDQIESWLRDGGETITDGDDEDDNVEHSQKKYIRLDALGAMQAVNRELRLKLLQQKVPFKK